MLFGKTSALLAAAGVALANPIPSSGFQWGSEQIKGVCLGGWLVLEPWITPSIFQHFSDGGVVDEYTLGERLGQDAGYSMLKQHWDSWITEADFKQVADWGFNAVRIPIGFWAYDTYGYPYISGAAPYMDQAIEWARSNNLKVLIDLHGAPLSQNGFDNSGHRQSTPQWEQGDSVQQTIDVLNTISDKYAQAQYSDVVMGIELLNEPLSPDLNVDTLRQFYRDGYGQVRQVSPSTTAVLQDAFIPPSQWNGFLTPSDNNAQNVAVDHHEYQVFSDDTVAWDPATHRQQVCNMAQANYGGADKWSFVGEWTGAMTDCAYALNGYGVGARYDGTYPGSSYVGSCANINDISTWDSSLIENTRMYIEVQMEAFQYMTNGWFFWTLKTEGAAEWDLYRLISVGAFPQPITATDYGTQCSQYP